LGGSAVLRLKIAIGDEEPEVIGTAVGARWRSTPPPGSPRPNALLGSESGRTARARRARTSARRETRARSHCSSSGGRGRARIRAGHRARIDAHSCRSRRAFRFLVALVGGADRTNGRAALQALAPFSHDRATSEAVRRGEAWRRHAEDLAEHGF
jgi:hypothetical protein